MCDFTIISSPASASAATITNLFSSRQRQRAHNSLLTRQTNEQTDIITENRPFSVVGVARKVNSTAVCFSADAPVSLRTNCSCYFSFFRSLPFGKTTECLKKHIIHFTGQKTKLPQQVRRMRKFNGLTRRPIGWWWWWWWSTYS